MGSGFQRLGRFAFYLAKNLSPFDRFLGRMVIQDQRKVLWGLRYRIGAKGSSLAWIAPARTGQAHLKSIRHHPARL